MKKHSREKRASNLRDSWKISEQKYMSASEPEDKEYWLRQMNLASQALRDLWRTP
jgi:hypothetical protein